ncbi:MAG: hypothetical protein ACM3PE_04055 [Deltaproteobacteria bacterium]
MRINSEDGMKVFWFEADMNGLYLETAAMNTHGFFGDFQGNLSARHKNIEPGPGTISIAEVYRNALRSCARITDLKDMIGDKTVVYPPVPPEWNMLHNLFADRFGGALVLETSDGHNELTDIDGKCLVMTNFPVNEFHSRPLTEVTGAGDDRYKTACEYLERHEDVGVNEAFVLLQKTAQNTAGWKTLCSMVFDPIALKVHFVLNQAFGEVFTVDIRERSLTPPGSAALTRASMSLEGFKG